MLTLVVCTLITHRCHLLLDPAATMLQSHPVREHEATLFYCLLSDLIFSYHQDVIFKQ